MTEYNPGQPEPAEIEVNDQNGTITVDGEAFPYAIISGMVQIGNVAGDDPFVRFHVPATLVRRVSSTGVATVYTNGHAPFVDPDYEPDEE